MLLKKHSLAQLKMAMNNVFIALDVDRKDMRTKHTNLKTAAGNKLKEIILPVIDGNDVPEVLTFEEGTTVKYHEGGDTYLKR